MRIKRFLPWVFEEKVQHAYEAVCSRYSIEVGLIYELFGNVFGAFICEGVV